jgi:hypothetical protein
MRRRGGLLLLLLLALRRAEAGVDEGVDSHGLGDHSIYLR